MRGGFRQEEHEGHEMKEVADAMGGSYGGFGT
jgi:hypothetical protein